MFKDLLFLWGCMSYSVFLVQHYIVTSAHNALHIVDTQ